MEKVVYETEEKILTEQEAQQLLQSLGVGVSATVEGIGGGKLRLRITRLRRVADQDVFIDVWDCRGRLYMGKPEEEEWEELGWFSVPKRIFRPEIAEELENLLWQVIEDRGGAINMSGRYYLDKEHIEELNKIIRKGGGE